MLPTYASDDVEITWNGLSLNKGVAEDTFLSIEPLSERQSYKFGADGQIAFSKMANKGASISMTFQQTAPINKTLAKISAAQDLIGGDLQFSPFKVIDRTGDSAHFLALNAVLTEVPTNDYGNVSGERTWVWVCESYFLAEDISTITEQLDKYISF